MSDAIESKEWFGKLGARFISSSEGIAAASASTGWTPAIFLHKRPQQFPTTTVGPLTAHLTVITWATHALMDEAGTSAAERQRVRRVFTSFQLIDLRTTLVMVPFFQTPQFSGRVGEVSCSDNFGTVSREQ